MPPLLRSSTRFFRIHRRAILLALSIAVLFDALWIAYRPLPTIRVSPTSSAAAALPKRIFIASAHRNSASLLRSHWTPGVLALARHFGPDNVYVSLYESGSWDDTKEALGELDNQLEDLGVPRAIVRDEWDQMAEVERHPEVVEPGWIWTKNKIHEMRRIPFLAKLRNRVMEKLYEQRKKGIEYDIVLWLNDVVFNTEDILTLLSTRDGHYAAACAQDFIIPSIYYDTFALRDIEGQKAHPQAWPYFLAQASRHAALQNAPIPLKSCWNGAVAFKAAPFYANPPLVFRGLSDDLATRHVEASECCLVHADNERLSRERAGGVWEGVWMNPNVRVGYKVDAYKAVNPAHGVWPSRSRRVIGIWQNRLGRWWYLPSFWSERRKVEGRLRAWEEEEEDSDDDEKDRGGQKKEKKRRRRHEEAYCIINEMQVLVEGGWKHV